MDTGLTSVETDTDMPELIPQEEDDSDDKAEKEEEDSKVQQQPRCSAQIAQGILKPSKYAISFGTSVLTKEQQDAAISKVEEDEIRQVFFDLKALVPMKKEDIDGQPLNCHIFTVEKFLANGDHDKVKSRFVVIGNEQDQEL